MKKRKKRKRRKKEKEYRKGKTVKALVKSKKICKWKVNRQKRRPLRPGPRGDQPPPRLPARQRILVTLSTSLGIPIRSRNRPRRLQHRQNRRSHSLQKEYNVWDPQRTPRHIEKQMEASQRLLVAWVLSRHRSPRQRLQGMRQVPSFSTNRTANQSECGHPPDGNPRNRPVAQ